MSLLLRLIAADVVLFTRTGEMDSLTVRWETSFHTGHRCLCLSVTAVRIPGDLLTLNEPS